MEVHTKAMIALFAILLFVLPAAPRRPWSSFISKLPQLSKVRDVGTTFLSSSPRVTTAQGVVIGSWMTTRGGRQIAAFRGMPYAAPPVNQLRFKSPQPPDSWTRPRLAQNDGNSCIQYLPIVGVTGDEDCLYINVYSPDISSVGKLPVLFFIHGGGFSLGSSDSAVYSPEYILDEDVVLVTINYRLGVFGFLSFENGFLPGNFGLKDQRAALRWVKLNIAQFGGDPSAVTIFGESAGATSVHYHTLFNTQEGLFRAGILHSGSAFTTLLFHRPGDYDPVIHFLLNKTGCPEGNNASTVECLMKVPAKNMTNYVQDFAPPFNSLKRRFELTPVIEPDCVADAFVTSNPWNKTSSTPMIIGSNAYEGMLFLFDLFTDKTNERYRRFRSNFKTLLPFDLMYNTSAEDPDYVTQQLVSFYINNSNTDRENILHLANMYGDAGFIHGAPAAARSNRAPSYLYIFNYLGSKSFMEALGYNNNIGPCHADDLFMFFPLNNCKPLNCTRPDRKESQPAEDLSLSKQLIKMWTNFVRTGSPVPDGSNIIWAPLGQDLEYLAINGANNITFESGYHRERTAFWDNLPINNKPIHLESCLV